MSKIVDAPEAYFSHMLIPVAQVARVAFSIE